MKPPINFDALCDGLYMAKRRAMANGDSGMEVLIACTTDDRKRIIEAYFKHVEKYHGVPVQSRVVEQCFEAKDLRIFLPNIMADLCFVEIPELDMASNPTSAPASPDLPSTHDRISPDTE